MSRHALSPVEGAQKLLLPTPHKQLRIPVAGAASSDKQQSCSLHLEAQESPSPQAGISAVVQTSLQSTTIPAPKAVGAGSDAAAAELQRLRRERDKLLGLGIYSENDPLIMQLQHQIRGKLILA